MVTNQEVAKVVDGVTGLLRQLDNEELSLEDVVEAVEKLCAGFEFPSDTLFLAKIIAAWGIKDAKIERLSIGGNFVNLLVVPCAKRECGTGSHVHVLEPKTYLMKHRLVTGVDQPVAKTYDGSILNKLSDVFLEYTQCGDREKCTRDLHKVVADIYSANLRNTREFLYELTDKFPAGECTFLLGKSNGVVHMQIACKLQTCSSRDRRPHLHDYTVRGYLAYYVVNILDPLVKAKNAASILGELSGVYPPSSRPGPQPEPQTNPTTIMPPPAIPSTPSTPNNSALSVSRKRSGTHNVVHADDGRVELASSSFEFKRVKLRNEALLFDLQRIRTRNADLESQVKALTDHAAVFKHSMRDIVNHVAGIIAALKQAKEINVQNGGVQNGGVQNGGVQNVGVQPVGVQPVGVQPVGVQPVGVQPVSQQQNTPQLVTVSAVSLANAMRTITTQANTEQTTTQSEIAPVVTQA